MKKYAIKFLLLAVLSIFPMVLMAQNPDWLTVRPKYQPVVDMDSVQNPESRLYRSSFDFRFSFPFILHSSSSALNPILQTQGFPGLRNGELMVGITTSYRFKRLRVGYDLIFNEYNKDRPGTDLRVTNNGFNFWLGYNIIQKKNFSLYPMVGFSRFSSELLLGRVSTLITHYTGIIPPVSFFPVDGVLPPTLDNLLMFTSGNSFRLTNSNDGLMLALGLDLLEFYKRRPSILSFRAGKRFGPGGGSAWASPYNNLINTPSDRMGFWFAEIQLGSSLNW